MRVSLNWAQVLVGNIRSSAEKKLQRHEIVSYR